MARKGKYKPPTYLIQPENLAKREKDTFLPVHKSLLRNEAFRSLSGRQIILLLDIWLHAREQENAKMPELMQSGETWDIQRPPGALGVFFFYPWAAAQKLGCYTKHQRFYEDIRALIEKGFICKVWRPKGSKDMTIFMVSDNYKKH